MAERDDRRFTVNSPARDSVVKQGGVAREPSEAEDVTRDTYGGEQPAPVSTDTDERVAEANRAAAAAGLPGVTVPEAQAGSEMGRPQEQDEEAGRVHESGDRIASREDVEKLKSP
jgi:hypothetical protein